MTVQKISAGQRFGLLTAVSSMPTNGRRKVTAWTFRCDCGAVVTRLLCHLGRKGKPGKNIRCGRQCKLHRTIAPGKVFGNLIALAQTGQRYFASAVWEFGCICGNTILRPMSSVMSSTHYVHRQSTPSCGCCRTAANGQSLTPRRPVEIGERLGLLKVLRQADTKNGMHYFHCICDCGNQTVVRANLLRFGQTKSCGHLSGRVKSKRVIPLQPRGPEIPREQSGTSREDPGTNRDDTIVGVQPAARTIPDAVLRFGVGAYL